MKRNKVINCIKNISISVPRTLNHDNKTVTNPVEIPNTFNNHFFSVAVVSSVIHINIILNTWKIVPLNHSFYLLLMRMKFRASFLAWIQTNLLVLVVNLQKFLNCWRIKFHFIFPTFISLFYECIPISSENCQSHFCAEKDSKLYCSNYRPVPLSPIIENILEKLVYNRNTNFSNDNNLI